MDELIKIFTEAIKIDNFEQMLWTLITVGILYGIWKVNQKFIKWYKIFRYKTIDRLFNNNYKNIKNTLLDIKGKYKPDRISIIQFFNGTEYLSRLQRLHFEISHVIGEIDRNKDCNVTYNCSLFYYGFFEYFTQHIKTLSDNCWELLHLANVKTDSDLENLYLFNISKEYENPFNINLNYHGVKNILARGIYSNNGALISILMLDYLEPVKVDEGLSNIVINNNSFSIADVNKYLTQKIMELKKNI